MQWREHISPTVVWDVTSVTNVFQEVRMSNDILTRKQRLKTIWRQPTRLTYWSKSITSIPKSGRKYSKPIHNFLFLDCYSQGFSKSKYVHAHMQRFIFHLKSRQIHDHKILTSTILKPMVYVNTCFPPKQVDLPLETDTMNMPKINQVTSVAHYHLPIVLLKVSLFKRAN